MPFEAHSSPPLGSCKATVKVGVSGMAMGLLGGRRWSQRGSRSINLAEQRQAWAMEAPATARIGQDHERRGAKKKKWDQFGLDSSPPVGRICDATVPHTLYV